MSVKSELRKQAKRITRLYQKEINKKALVDTGALVRSFETKISLSKKGDLSIDFRCMDYFKYLDEPYDVTDDILSIMIDSYLNKIPDNFEVKESVEYNFKFKNIKT